VAKRRLYRDRKTGRFISKATWKRSRARGGTRYVRQTVKVRKRRPPKPKRLPPGKLKEWLVTWEYDSDKGMRVLDFYAVTVSEARALEIVAQRVARGKDDLGYNLAWALRIEWDRVFVTRFEREPKEKREALTQERVEVH